MTDRWESGYGNRLPEWGCPLRSEPKQSDVLSQINQAWEHAKDQLATLKAEVGRANEMAQASLQAKFLTRDKDKALRDLGEAVWSLVKKGKLQLPPALAAQARAMQEMEKKIEAQSRQINDLLQEGEEAAERLKQKKAPRNSVVAGKGKKR